MTDKNSQGASRPIYKFAQELVNSWSETGQITLRPSEKETLKKLIASSIPLFVMENRNEALDSYINTLMKQQQDSCVEAVAEVSETFCGVINRQRAIQACAQAKRITQKEYSQGTLLDSEMT